MQVKLRAFLSTEVDEGEWLESRSGRFIPEERIPAIHCTVE